MPRPTSLVVKKGSKMRSATSRGMPLPVSVMLTITFSPSWRVSMTIEPRSPDSPTRSSIACAALTIRLRKTWFMSPPLQSTGGSVPKSVVTSAMYL